MAQSPIVTFGCRLNSYESEKIEKHLSDLSAENILVVNTCAVTQESVRQCKQTIRKLKRRHPKKKIILTGCAAHIDTETFLAMPEVDGIVDNTQKLEASAWAEILGIPKEKRRTSDSNTEERPPAPKRARTFLEIQNGCDHRCTFCIIPYGRGPSRSRSRTDIVVHIKQLIQDGFKEITLTGVDLTSYCDTQAGEKSFRLGDLVFYILDNVPNLPRLRLSSLDVAEIDPLLFELISTHDRLMPHIHLSLQAGDTMILKRMKRRHTREQAIDFCTQLLHKRPYTTLGADLIAGFPTETEAMFQNTFDIITACQLTWLHVFPFSPREGTPAARMPHVEPRIVKERAEQLRQKGAEQKRYFFQKQVGKTVPLLMETAQLGRGEDFSQVFIQNGAYCVGEFCYVHIVDYTTERLLGKTVEV